MRKTTRYQTVVDSPSRAPKRATDRVGRSQTEDAVIARMLSPAARRDYKAELVQQLGFLKIEVEPEFYFAKPRRWRSDWRVKNLHVLIEFEGGLFHTGKRGHSSVSGILRDIEKYNTATIAGWLVVRVTPKHIVSGQALTWIEEACAKAKQQIETIKKARQVDAA